MLTCSHSNDVAGVEFCSAGDDVQLDGTGAVPALCDYIAYHDAGKKLAYAKQHIAETGNGFFLAVGIRRPHLTWRAPPGYQEMFHADDVALPTQLVLDKSIDPIAWTEFPALGGNNPYAINNTMREIKEYRAAYYAAVAWADYVAGAVLDELEAKGLSDTTAVVMHSDHGWHLGEYNMWEKRTLWENAAHVPLIIRVPWLPKSAGKRAKALVELVDVYPTVCQLLGVDLPTDDAHPVEGISLVPLLDDPSSASSWPKTAALTTYVPQ